MQPSSPDFGAKTDPSGTGGTMRMACKKTAIAIGALMLAAAFGCATGKHGADVHPTSDAASQTASPKSASSAKVTARVQEASFSEDTDGARLVLSSDSP